MLSVTHLVVVRSTMTRKLDLVLNVFETASYLPTLKGMHIPVNKEKALGLEVLEHSARAVEEGAYNEDRRGLRAPTSRRDGSSPYLTPEGRIRYDGEEEVPIGGHRQLWAMPMGSLVSSLGMEQHIKASHQGEGEAPKRPSQCGVLFRMNVTEDTAKVSLRNTDISFLTRGLICHDHLFVRYRRVQLSLMGPPTFHHPSPYEAFFFFGGAVVGPG